MVQRRLRLQRRGRVVYATISRLNPPFERTGAGDAFSSTFVAGLAMGKTIEEALMMAPINSMSVVPSMSLKGLLTLPELENIFNRRLRIINREKFRFLIFFSRLFHRFLYIFDRQTKFFLKARRVLPIRRSGL